MFRAPKVMLNRERDGNVKYYQDCLVKCVLLLLNGHETKYLMAMYGIMFYSHVTMVTGLF